MITRRIKCALCHKISTKTMRVGVNNKREKLLKQKWSGRWCWKRRKWKCLNEGYDEIAYRRRGCGGGSGRRTRFMI